MPGLEDMIKVAKKSLGLKGRPNYITEWYAKRNGVYYREAPWCQMAITYWAYHSGNYEAVCFNKDWAYTVWAAQEFEKRGQWHVDTAGIKPGDIAFFDWAGTNSIAHIDHVGIVVGVNGRDITVLESNTNDSCALRVRSASTIVGYGRPKYAESTAAPTLDGAAVLAALAKLKSTVVSKSKYATDAGGSGKVDVNKTSTGVYWFKADMDIDTDGQPFPEMDADSPTRQSETAFVQSDGKPLNSGKLPFIVLPLASGVWDYKKAGIKGGDAALVIYNGKMVPAVVGDLGPAEIIGEGSYALAKNLGVKGIPHGGIDDIAVTYIIFPGATVKPIEDAAKAIEVGKAKAAELIASAKPSPAPAPSPTVSLANLQMGDRHEDVGQLQTALKAKGYSPGPIDSWFGEQTKAAVKKFQQAQGWSGADADGIPGAESVTRLGLKLVASSAPAPAPSADDEPAHDYRRVTYGGKTVNVRTKVMLERAVEHLAEHYEWTPVLTQGSYNKGVSASAGTHDGGGVIDIRTSTMSRKGQDQCVQALRKAGFAAWLRLPPAFSTHIHAVSIGDRELSAAAKSQIQQWREDRDGLAGRRPDPYADPYPAWTRKYR